MSTTFTVPTLQTERLVLRAPELSDAKAYCDILTSKRAIYMGGPFTQEDAWLDFCAGVSGWMLRGFGAFSAVRKDTGAFVGLIFMHHEYGDPEQELGWVLTETAEGNGYGHEAGRAILDYAFGPLGWDTAVSYIDANNARSIALATRLGAALDPKAAQPNGDTPCLVYRYPTPERAP